MEDFKKGSDAYMEETQKLTSVFMTKITSNLKTQLNHPMKLRGITPENMVYALMKSLEPLELDEGKAKQLRAAMVPLFTNLQDLAKQFQGIKKMETKGHE